MLTVLGAFFCKNCRRSAGAMLYVKRSSSRSDHHYCKPLSYQRRERATWRSTFAHFCGIRIKTLHVHCRRNKNCCGNCQLNRFTVNAFHKNEMFGCYDMTTICICVTSINQLFVYMFVLNKNSFEKDVNVK